MTRCMMNVKNIPHCYWGEAVNTAVYLLNRAPTRALFNSTPYELWYNRKPDISHLRIFGSLAYSLISAASRNKLESKGEKTILLGYNEESKAYRLYNPLTDKLIIARDVIIDEESEWVWENSLDQNSIQQVTSQETPLDIEIRAQPSLTEEGQHNDSSEDDSGSPLESSSPQKFRLVSDIYQDSNIAAIVIEPTNYKEAVKEELWRAAMEEELHVINKNKTWELAELPAHKTAIGLKWLFKIKHKEDGSVLKYKARLVAKGYAQKPDSDYFETFAPVARFESIRMLLALAAENNYHVYQLDVKSAFLNGEIKEEIYVQQPEGFVVPNESSKVYKLKKALYGLKQSPRAWNSKIDASLLRLGFTKTDYEPALYIRHTQDGLYISLCIYVDDLLITGSDAIGIATIKEKLQAEFEMTDLGHVKYFLGMQIARNNLGILITQTKYSDDLLIKFNMEAAKPASTPMAAGEKFMKEDGEEKVNEEEYRSLVGSLIYLTNTRPDIEFAVSIVSRFMHSPSIKHLAAAKRILRYIKGTRGYGLSYSREDTTKEGREIKEKEKRNKIYNLQGYSDSDWGGCFDDRRSTSGHIFFLNNMPISWSSRKQKTVALSSTEAEYVSLTEAAREGVWIKRMLEKIETTTEVKLKIKIDNTSAIALAYNPIFHNKTKHLELKWHYARELVSNGEVTLEYCPTKSQIADALTKGLATIQFEELRKKMRIINSLD
ncbi:hypothetical protein KSP39_PZI023850 [Platanthera zijinensis]|uniref:Retrovirus-related Pol polyprotein from transposon TNT 1-94 n=1 Tax=Platanthera zijinensis TaxID=2320716 RepID=A0AAP0FU88_9ASPA